MPIPCDDKLVKQFEGMVWKLALWAKNHGNPCDLDELVSAGFLGLVEAARRFDSTRGTVFCTIAFLGIRDRINNEARPIRRRPAVLMGDHDKQVAEHRDTRPGRTLEDKELWQMLRSELNAREYQVTREYYVKGRVNREIAEQCGLSAVRIDQIKHKIVQKLRRSERIKAYA